MRNAECGIKAPASQPYTEKRDKGFADLKREEMSFIPLSERHDGFREVELGFNEDQAREEANRCLQCDLELCSAQEARHQEDK